MFDGNYKLSAGQLDRIVIFKVWLLLYIADLIQYIAQNKNLLYVQMLLGHTELLESRLQTKQRNWGLNPYCWGPAFELYLMFSNTPPIFQLVHRKDCRNTKSEKKSQIYIKNKLLRVAVTLQGLIIFALANKLAWS